MKRINVIHIITRLAIGGAQENTILTVSHVNKGIFDSLIVSGEEHYEEGNLMDVIKKKRIKHFTNKFLVRQIHPFKDLLCLISLVSSIRKHRGKIVHTHSSKAGILGRCAAKIAGSRIIIHTVHGWSFHDRMGKWKKRLFILLERIMEKFSAKLICVTNQDVKKGLFESIGTKEKYAIIRSGFEIEKFKKKRVKEAETKKRLGLPLKKRIVGTVGRFSYQKDPETFIRVAQRVLQERKDVIFVVVGDGELRPHIEQLIKELEVCDAVFLLGAQKNVEEIFPLFDIFLLTSLWEGLPKVVPQAMASKVPVVSTAVNGVKEVIRNGENGYLTATKDVESLAKNVIKLLDDESIRKKFTSKSMSIVNQFDASLMVKEIERLYLDLLKAD